MLLVALKLGVWIEQRILVIESGDIPDVQDAVLHAVNPTAAIRARVRRKTECVSNTSRWIAIIRQLPQFFYADAVHLRLTAIVEIQTLDELLRQRTPRSLSEHRHLRMQIDTRLEIGLRLSFLVNSLVARANTDDVVLFVIQHLRAGKVREDVDASLFAFLAEPGRQAIQRHDVVAVILQRRWRNRRAERVLLRQIQKVIFIHE